MTETTSWRMFAHQRHGTFWDVGSRRYVELHCLPDPVVEVAVTLVADDDPTATHWGWISKSGDPEPSMIWPNLACYQTCFTYGPEAEEKAGKGRTVRLAVSAVQKDGEDCG